MKRLLSILILTMCIVLPSDAAFWNRNKGQATSAPAQVQNNTSVQTQTSPQQTQSQATYPNDVNSVPIAEDEYTEDIDVEDMYRKMPVPDFKYVHNVDPGEYQDTMYSTWSPYPLFRLTTPLYFKTITIEPGYYLLTPREHEGKWYMLFKEAGKIKYIIPCYKKEMVPYGFYQNNLPQIRMTVPQVIREKALKFVGKHFDSSKRKPIPDTYLEAEDLDDNFISIIVYWGNYRYYFVLRSIQL